MKRITALFLVVICLFCLTACIKGDAPYSEIPKNTDGYEMKGADIDVVRLPVSFEEYARTSELAVECEYVGPCEYMRLETKGVQKNFTLNRFKVISVLQGTFQESEIIVRTDGGTVYLKNDCIDERYNLTPDFKEGERWILFLNKGSRLDRFCIDREYYCINNDPFYLDEKEGKYHSRGPHDTLPLTADSAAEFANGYCFTAAELKDLLGSIGAPTIPTDEQQRKDYIIKFQKEKLEKGEISKKAYDKIVENTKIYNYSRIVVRHKAEK